MWSDGQEKCMGACQSKWASKSVLKGQLWTLYNFETGAWIWWLHKTMFPQWIMPLKKYFLLLWICLVTIILSCPCGTEKTMAPHSSTLAWKILWTKEPGRLQSMRSRRVEHNWATSLSLFTSMHWRRKWQPTPVFLPGESQGRGSLVGCRLWGHTELDTTEAT